MKAAVQTSQPHPASNTDFNLDLKEGRQVEREAMDMLLGDTALLPLVLMRYVEHAGRDYDFALWITAEVKSDKVEARTGNICFEVWDSRRQCWSGILASRAQIVIYKLSDAWFIFNRKKLAAELRKYLRQEPSPDYLLKGNREGKRDRNMLFPRAKVETQFESLITTKYFEERVNDGTGQ